VCVCLCVCVCVCVQGAARAAALCDPVFDGMDNMLAALVQQVCARCMLASCMLAVLATVY
jgi:hypothetical protein